MPINKSKSKLSWSPEVESKNNIFDITAFDFFSNSIKTKIDTFDIKNLNILELLKLNKDLKKSFVGWVFYEVILDNIHSKIKKSYPHSLRRFSHETDLSQTLSDLEDILNVCYKEWYISKWEYIFVFQDVLWWQSFNIDNLFEEIACIDSYFEWDKEVVSNYSIRLEKQTKYSKQITDYIANWSNIPVWEFIISAHIDTHKKNEKLSISKLTRDIYNYCKSIEKDYEITPKYICNFTHLGTLFHRYGFDIYSLQKDLSTNTQAYKTKISEKVYEEKPDDMDDSERLDYQEKLPNVIKMQNKFTYKDIKFGIIKYDKLIRKLEDMLQISKEDNLTNQTKNLIHKV